MRGLVFPTTDERRIMNEEGCVEHNAFETPFNSRTDDLAPFFGLMFSLRAKGHSITVRTFQLDVRLEDATDLSVEVWARQGGYRLLAGSSEGWSFVANSTLVPHPSGEGAIVPVSDFEGVQMTAEEQWSFYVSLRGPWLDYTVYQPDVAGDIDKVGAHFDLYTGSGLLEYNFGATNTFAHPKFAGIIHYDLEEQGYDCPVVPVATQVTFHLSIDSSLNATVLSEINSVLDSLLREEVRRVVVLEEFQSKYGLVQADKPSSRTGSVNAPCPTGWDLCSSVEVMVDFLHSDNLSQGRVLHALYASAGRLIGALQEGLGTNAIYTGFVDTAATFEMGLNGIEASTSMNDRQLTYLAGAITEFLNHALSDTETLVVTIDSQAGEHTHRRLRGHADKEARGLKSTLQLRGTVLGAQMAYLEPEGFASAIERALESGSEQFLLDLAFGLTLPGSLGDRGDDSDFFRGVSGISSFAEVLPLYNYATQEPIGSMDDNIPEVDDAGTGATIIYVGAGLGAVILAIFVLTCGWRRVREARSRKDTSRKVPTTNKTPECALGFATDMLADPSSNSILFDCRETSTGLVAGAASRSTRPRRPSSDEVDQGGLQARAAVSMISDSVIGRSEELSNFKSRSDHSKSTGRQKSRRDVKITEGGNSDQVEIDLVLGVQPGSNIEIPSQAIDTSQVVPHTVTELDSDASGVSPGLIADQKKATTVLEDETQTVTSLSTETEGDSSSSSRKQHSASVTMKPNFARSRSRSRSPSGSGSGSRGRTSITMAPNFARSRSRSRSNSPSAGRRYSADGTLPRRNSAGSRRDSATGRRPSNESVASRRNSNDSVRSSREGMSRQTSGSDRWENNTVKSEEDAPPRTPRRTTTSHVLEPFSPLDAALKNMSAEMMVSEPQRRSSQGPDHRTRTDNSRRYSEPMTVDQYMQNLATKRSKAQCTSRSVQLPAANNLAKAKAVKEFEDAQMRGPLEEMDSTSSRHTSRRYFDTQVSDPRRKMMVTSQQTGGSSRRHSEPAKTATEAPQTGKRRSSLKSTESSVLLTAGKPGVSSSSLPQEEAGTDSASTAVSSPGDAGPSKPKSRRRLTAPNTVGEHHLQQPPRRSSLKDSGRSVQSSKASTSGMSESPTSAHPSQSENVNPLKAKSRRRLSAPVTAKDFMQQTSARKLGAKDASRSESPAMNVSSSSNPTSIKDAPSKPRHRRGKSEQAVVNEQLQQKSRRGLGTKSSVRSMHSLEGGDVDTKSTKRGGDSSVMDSSSLSKKKVQTDAVVSKPTSRRRLSAPTSVEDQQQKKLPRRTNSKNSVRSLQSVEGDKADSKAAKEAAKILVLNSSTSSQKSAPKLPASSVLPRRRLSASSTKSAKEIGKGLDSSTSSQKSGQRDSAASKPKSRRRLSMPSSIGGQQREQSTRQSNVHGVESKKATSPAAASQKAQSRRRLSEPVTVEEHIRKQSTGRVRPKGGARSVQPMKTENKAKMKTAKEFEDIRPTQGAADTSSSPHKDLPAQNKSRRYSAPLTGDSRNQSHSLRRSTAKAGAQRSPRYEGQSEAVAPKDKQSSPSVLDSSNASQSKTKIRKSLSPQTVIHLGTPALTPTSAGSSELNLDKEALIAELKEKLDSSSSTQLHPGFRQTSNDAKAGALRIRARKSEPDKEAVIAELKEKIRPPPKPSVTNSREQSVASGGSLAAISIAQYLTHDPTLKGGALSSSKSVQYPSKAKSNTEHKVRSPVRRSKSAIGNLPTPKTPVRRSSLAALPNLLSPPPSTESEENLLEDVIRPPSIARRKSTGEPNLRPPKPTTTRRGSLPVALANSNASPQKRKGAMSSSAPLVAAKKNAQDNQKTDTDIEKGNDVSGLDDTLRMSGSRPSPSPDSKSAVSAPSSAVPGFMKPTASSASSRIKRGGRSRSSERTKTPNTTRP